MAEKIVLNLRFSADKTSENSPQWIRSDKSAVKAMGAEIQLSQILYATPYG